MRFLSVCSGIEAASVAFNPLGWKAVAFSEIEPFPCSLLAHHYPNTPNWGDMNKFKEWPDVSIDLLCGGTPCQSFSVAGLRKGLDDPRGNLMLTFGAIAAKYRPKWIFWENVPGVLSSNGGRDFGSFLGMLGQLGYGFAYKVCDAQYHGVAQRRRRVFVVGCLGDWHSAAAVLFERHSLQWNPAPRRKARQGITGGIEIGPAGGSFTDMSPTLDTRAKDGPVRNQLAGAVLDVAGTMKSCKDSGGWSNSADHAAAGYMVPVGVTIHGTDKTAKVCSYTEIAGALRARTPGSQENSSTTVLMVPNLHADISPALKARDSKGPSSDGDGDGAILVPMAYRTAGDGAVFEEGEKTAPLTTQTDPCANVIAYTTKLHNTTSNNTGKIFEERTVALDANSQPPALLTAMAVRRLTVTECERLMGFPDGYTNVMHKGKPAADGNRYKALGNSWVVPNVSWIGRRIQDVSAVLESTKKLEAA